LAFVRGVPENQRYGQSSASDDVLTNIGQEKPMVAGFAGHFQNIPIGNMGKIIEIWPIWIVAISIV
jgi:hypothetical protein